MKPIIIGAGRGSRLNAMTDSQPKCYAPIGGRRILDWLLEALAIDQLDAPVFIGGYQIDMIKGDYPHLAFRHNADWQNNNILASLFYAEADMKDGFVCTYADILYRSSVVERALAHAGDIVICVDTEWRKRYADRTAHPEADAEKVIVQGDRVLRIDRTVTSDKADGEYIGVTKFTAAGAAKLQAYYHRVRSQFADSNWPEDKPFAKAYLIPLLDEMIRQGEPVHCVSTAGDYMEIDTEEDYALANASWPARFAEAPGKE
jgi:choline kinase